MFLYFGVRFLFSNTMFHLMSCGVFEFPDNSDAKVV